MKVSLNVKFVDGPFGGAIQFAHSFKVFLEEKGCTVINHLKDDDIDIILHIAPFPFQEISAYSFIDAAIYKLRNQNTKIVLRINIVDEGKGTNYMNKLLISASLYSDYLIFIASWLIPLLEKSGLSKTLPRSVILNGADENTYNTRLKKKYHHTKKLKIVTHHWSSNLMKGHDIYQKLDELLSDPFFSDKFEFTYIGNIPSGMIYKNTKIINPLSGINLSRELQSHDIYLTAAKGEAGGMHHIEGALCGLPILYLESGALPEYCHRYGLGFDANNFCEKLLEMQKKYPVLIEKISDYPYTSTYMNSQYYSLLKKLVEEKEMPLKKTCVFSKFKLNIQIPILNTKSFIIRINDFIRGKLI